MKLFLDCRRWCIAENRSLLCITNVGYKYELLRAKRKVANYLKYKCRSFDFVYVQMVKEFR